MTADPVLDELCASAERAWIDRRDPEAVDRLAAEHPEHAAELYDFFAALVAAEGDAALPAEAAERAAERTRGWLAEEGLDRALAASRRPRSFSKYLRELTGERPEAIVRRIGGVTWELLTLVSRHPAVVPPAARRELASRVARACNVPAAECLRRIEISRPVARAASRQEPYPPAPASFEELLDRASLTAEDRSFWLEAAG